MTSQAEIRARFWKALRDDRTIMLGLEGAAAGDIQPMTALIEDKDEEGGPLWIFTARDSDLVGALGTSARAVAAWFEGGKDDPKLALLRLDPEQAKIWLNATTFEAATQWLFGRDPKQEYRDKVAEVSL